MKGRSMRPGCQDSAVTAENLDALDAPELLPVSEAGNQCLLIAMDHVAKELRAALLLTARPLFGWEASGEPSAGTGGAPFRSKPPPRLP